MNQITEAPNRYDAGYAFNYSQWTENTVMTMVNVPWNNDYRDVVRFPSRDHLDSWIDSQKNLPITKMSLLKFNQNVRVNLTMNRAMEYNYVRASNPAMPISNDFTRNYYYFITDVIYRAPQVTELVLQLDVWQTFGYDVTLGNCFIERGHIGIANTKAFNHYGRDYLTVPEGLDVGGEYRIVHTEHELVMDNGIDNDTTSGYDILVCSTLDLTQDPGDLGNPGLDSAKGSSFQGVPTGASFYLFRTVGDLRGFFEVYSNKPWITQSIISITLIPNMSRYAPEYNYGTNLSTDPSFDFYAAGSDSPTWHQRSVLPAWRNKSFLTNILGAQYDVLKKFLTYPYLVLELTTWTGSPVVIRPESWQDPDATIRELAAFMPPGQRIVAMPHRYNADDETTIATQTDQGEFQYVNPDDFGEFLNMAVTLDNFPSMPIVNNMAAAFLAQNRHGLAFEFRSADWSQQRALNAANTGFNQAGAGMNLQNQLTGIGTGATSAQAALQAQTMAGQAAIGAIGDVAGGAVGGAFMGPAGMALGAAGGAVQGAAGIGQSALGQNQVVQGAGISNQAANASNAARVGTAGYMRDTNLALAQFSAKGDYANQVAGINAKIQDARLTQPSTSGQFGGDAFNLINNLFGYSLRWKMPSLNNLRMIGDFWLRYGYAINQYGTIPTNFMCMEKFTYWKLTETYISQAAIPESFKQVIRGIFEKGVTVWAAPEFIGRISLADNNPLPNISY